MENTTGIMPVMDMNNNDWGNGCSWMWIFILFLLIGGNGFWGRGGYGYGYDMCGGGPASTEDVQNQFNFAALERQNNEIIGAVRDNSKDVIEAVKEAGYNNLYAIKDIDRGVERLGYQMSSCCCETNRNIDSLKYEQAQQTQAITQAIHSEGECTRALLVQQETTRLRDELAQAREIIANTAQTQNILGQLGTYYTNPPCYGNTCGCN